MLERYWRKKRVCGPPTKLARANDLATQGKLQSEIARTLGVSVMTLHRWHKADDRIAELRLENSRLRRLVTDLLLEKIKLEEAAQRQTFSAWRGRNGHPDNDRVSLSENSIRPGFASWLASWPKPHHRKSAKWRQELFGTIAQRLNLKHEFHHTASKQCILGFEPLK
jgi:putative transposase